MRIDPMIVAKEYYEEVKHLYPELDFKEFAEICYVPWKYTKKHMIAGKLPTIRLKFFGLFSVTVGRVKNELIRIENDHNNGYMPTDIYTKVKEKLNRYMENENIKSKN